MNTTSEFEEPSGAVEAYRDEWSRECQYGSGG